MVISAIVVDVSRLIIYGTTFFAGDFAVLKSQGGIDLVVAGSLAAFLGSRLVGKITMRFIQIFVGIMLLLLSVALGLGLV